MSESVTGVICDQLEGRLWDRLNVLVADGVLLHAWDRSMIPNVDRMFNRVFNPVETPPVVETINADV